MRRTIVRRVVVLVSVLLMGPLAAHAQPSTTVHRIGFLSSGSPLSGPESGTEAFQQGLRDLGYVEGQNLVIEHRYAEGHVARLPGLAVELVRLPVDVIVTGGTPATRAAKQATSTIPIVMTAMGIDPVASGLVASLAQPEGNLTGVTALGAELWEKRLALLVNAANPNATCLREVTAVTQALGVQLHPLEIRDAGAFEPAFAALAQEPPDALAICWDALTGTYARPIAGFAIRHHLPTLAPMKVYVQAGALLAYGTNIAGQMRRAADYVDKLLKGARPADLPVERPLEFELVINLQTARALGLTLPAMLLFQATEVIR